MIYDSAMFLVSFTLTCTTACRRRSGEGCAYTETGGYEHVRARVPRPQSPYTRILLLHAVAQV